MKWKFVALISISMFLMGFYTAPVFQSDITGDGKTDMEDFAILSKNWLKGVDMSLGPELVVNGGFDTDLSSWGTETWEWDDGTAYHWDTKAEGDIRQTIDMVPAGNYRLSFFSTMVPAAYINSNLVVPTSSGASTYFYDFTLATLDSVELSFLATALTQFDIDNVSVREVLADGSLGIELMMDEMDQ